MKKLILITVLSSLCLAGCGALATGTSSSDGSSSGSNSMISFVTDSGIPVEVTVDDKYHGVVSVKKSAYERDKNFQRDARNAILLTPGEHKVKVKVNGKEVYEQTVRVSSSERKVIELE